MRLRAPMPPPPPQRRLSHGRSFLLVLLLVLLLARWTPASAAALSTFALAKAADTTIVCGLLPSNSSPLLVDLNCTAASGDHARQETYPSSHPFSALAGGEDFLCAVGPTSIAGEDSDSVDMRWWDLSHHGNDSLPKRVYAGPPLRALDSGEYRVCGVLASGELHCWRWRGLALPRSLQFSAVAVGDGFVCGIVAEGQQSVGSIRCFGDDPDDEAVAGAPRDEGQGGGGGGGYDVVEACGSRACALTRRGGVRCWGRGAPAVGPDGDAGFAALALGETGACGLRTNGTIRCFGDDVSSPPGELARLQYVGVQAQGDCFCGVLMANYSLVCWGGREFHASNRLVFGRVLPGPCVDMASCQCGVLPGSASLCADGLCVCVDCAFELNVAVPNATIPLPAGGNGNNNTSSRSRRTMWIVIGAAVLLLLAALQGALLLWFRRRKRRNNSANDGSDMFQQRPGSFSISAVERFTIEALAAATDNFSDARRIGSGSFGSVYRGTLPSGRDVAIKRAEEPASARPSTSRPLRRRDREAAFASELTALARANHKNIVCLLGCCAVDDDDGGPGERVLVYEFMANGTLHDQLHGTNPLAPPVASWRGRLGIALDAARGIEYMHVYAVPPVIHRDVKSANILLDDAWTAKIADFGLSSVLDATTAARCPDNNNNAGDTPPPPPVYTGGTVGYMDPEYYRLQHLTDKSDVYSFGVVLLELLSGLRVVQRYAESATPRNVVEFAVPLILADDVARVLDPRLPAPNEDEAEALAYVGYLAADCVSPVGCDRPSMTEVVDGLERALAVCSPPAQLSRVGTAARRALSRSGTDHFDLTDTE